MGARCVVKRARPERRIPAAFVAMTRQYTRRLGSRPGSVAETGTSAVPAGSDCSGVRRPKPVVWPYSAYQVVAAPCGFTSARTTGSVGELVSSRNW